MCTFGIHTIYSCIDGFFFNPISGKCQYFPVVRNFLTHFFYMYNSFLYQENKMKCVEIVKQMKDMDLLPLAESVKGKRKYL
jgi:hypothetical protein